MKKKIPAIEYNALIEPKRAHGYKNVRWVENVSRGLRLVGFADDINKLLHHTGWFIDDCRDAKYRGVVYQVPARDGEGYAFGYADPNNDDCALLCFDLEGDKRDAARAADRFAEIFAEQEREYHEAWQAGRRVENIAEEIVNVRTSALTLAEEMRQAKQANVVAPTICASIRAEILHLYHQIKRLRKERDSLINDFGKRPGFVE